MLDTTGRIGDTTLTVNAFRFDLDDDTEGVEVHFVASEEPAAPSLNPLTVAFYEEVQGLSVAWLHNRSHAPSTCLVLLPVTVPIPSTHASSRHALSLLLHCQYTNAVHRKYWKNETYGK